MLSDFSLGFLHGSLQVLVVFLLDIAEYINEYTCRDCFNDSIVLMSANKKCYAVYTAVVLF